MNSERLSPPDYTRLLQSIIPILLQNGLKATTMDFVASSLSMSKRTIYEVFDNKRDMLTEVIKEMGRTQRQAAESIFEETENVVEAIIRIYSQQRDVVSRTNPSFFQDLEALYEDVRRVYEQNLHLNINEKIKIFEKGKEQGILRKEIDYHCIQEVHHVLMMSLKMSRDVIANPLPSFRIFDAMTVATLRTIVVPEYIPQLDKLLKENNITPI